MKEIKLSANKVVQCPKCKKFVQTIITDHLVNSVGYVCPDCYNEYKNKEICCTFSIHQWEFIKKILDRVAVLEKKIERLDRDPVVFAPIYKTPNPQKDIEWLNKDPLFNILIPNKNNPENTIEVQCISCKDLAQCQRGKLNDVQVLRMDEMNKKRCFIKKGDDSK